MDPEQNEREQAKALKARRRFLTVWTIVGAILLTGVLVYLFNLLSVPVGIVIWSVVIVFCLRGPVNKLEKLGVPRLAGTAIAYVLMFVVLALVGLLMFSPAFGVGDQFTNLIQSVPGYIQTIANWGNDLYVRYADVLQNDTVQGWITDAFNALVAWASTFARDSASGVVAIGTGVVNTFVALGFALVVAFWMLMELPDLGRESERLVGPKHREDLEMLHVTFTRVMGGYIKGTLLQCAIIGVGCVVLFGVIGIPNYAALGGIAGLLNIIPIMFDGDGLLTQVMMIGQDVGQKVELENLANTDGLTGLYNERYFSRVLANLEKKKMPFALYYLDLDFFKPINDTYGHDMGDKLLKAVAQRLQTCIRSRDCAFRIGGDEFAVVYRADLNETQRREKQALIVETLTQPYEIDGKRLQIGASCGYAHYPEDSAAAADIRILADQRMYAEKERNHQKSGGGR